MSTLDELYLDLANVVHPETRSSRDLAYEAAIKKALRHLDSATPKQRNGPTYQAADALRNAIGLEPMQIGGRPSDGLQ